MMLVELANLCRKLSQKEDLGRKNVFIEISGDYYEIGDITYDNDDLVIQLGEMC